MTTLLRTKSAALLKPRTNAARPSRIVLLEGHPIFSSGLAALINHEDDCEVCGIAQDYASAIELVEALNPDLTISDISFNGRDGLELLKDIKARRPKQRVLILSMHDESLYAPRALRAGALGYVMKHEAVETILTAIHKVLGGEIYVSERVAKQMLERFFGRRSGLLDTLECLTDRELEVLRKIGELKSTREIAAELHLSIKTIQSHRERLMQKLNLATGRNLLHYVLSRREVVVGVESTPFHVLAQSNGKPSPALLGREASLAPTLNQGFSR